MSQRKVQMIETECDGCGKYSYDPPGDPAYGLYINWTEVAGTGGWGGEFYACSEKCALKAIKRRNEIQNEKEGRA